MPGSFLDDSSAPGAERCKDSSLPLACEATMAAHSKDMNDLFHETLKDIYFSEKQILRPLPKMAKKAQSDELRQAFEKHRDQTEDQIERLDRVFELIGKPP